MGKDSDSWLHQQHSSWQLPDLNRTSPMPELGQGNIFPGYTYPYTCMVSANASLPGLAISELPHLKTEQANDRNGWFYCLPRHRQASIPSPNTIAKEKLSALPSGCGGSLPSSVSGTVQNRFLVFDQSGNQTSLFFGSMIGSPAQQSTSKNTKLFDTYGSCREDWTTNYKHDMIFQSGQGISDGLDENQETGDTSEMHEDTEELDALLYSDGDSDYDDEETSTGHYPGEFTGHEAHHVLEVSAEDVASSGGTSKRKRLLDEKQSLLDTASSMRRNVSWDYQDDADSSCVKGNKKTQEEELDPVPSNKRLKREKIREAVSILQSIIPGGKGKDAMFVLDEAIRYLRSMKAQC